MEAEEDHWPGLVPLHTAPRVHHEQPVLPLLVHHVHRGCRIDWPNLETKPIREDSVM